MTQNEYEQWSEDNLLKRKDELLAKIEAYQGMYRFASTEIVEHQKAVDRIQQVLKRNFDWLFD